MQPDFSKSPDSLIPAVVQDASTGVVLMVGFMNAEAFAATRESGRVTFFSRSRRRLWTKGETSGNFLEVEEILGDCDNDTLLIKARPAGPVCHTGAETCFGERNAPNDVLSGLERVVLERKANPSDDSYTSRLFARGLNKIAQKVGEEAVELVIEAKDDDPERFRNEAADLLYHLTVLLAAKDISFEEVYEVLKERRK